MAKGTYTNPLFDFAYFPSYLDSIRFLAEELADKEDWDFHDSGAKSYSILKNYLDFTFRKLSQEKR
ncbi:MAG: DUF3825 domain-containing protein [Bacteroidota bacterium]